MNIKAVILNQLGLETVVPCEHGKHSLVHSVEFRGIIINFRSKSVLVHEINGRLTISPIIQWQYLPLRPISPNFWVSIFERLLSSVFLVDTFRIFLNMILPESRNKFEN